LTKVTSLQPVIESCSGSLLLIRDESDIASHAAVCLIGTPQGESQRHYTGLDEVAKAVLAVDADICKIKRREVSAHSSPEPVVQTLPPIVVETVDDVKKKTLVVEDVKKKTVVVRQPIVEVVETPQPKPKPVFKEPVIPNSHVSQTPVGRQTSKHDELMTLFDEDYKVVDDVSNGWSI
jgi:hypothetical protein